MLCISASTAYSIRTPVNQARTSTVYSDKPGGSLLRVTMLSALRHDTTKHTTMRSPISTVSTRWIMLGMCLPSQSVELFREE